MSIAGALDWRRDDEFTLGGFVYRRQPEGGGDTAPDAFHFYKTPEQLAQFDRFFAETGFAPKRVLELGIWDGGSAAFWCEVLELDAYAAVDLRTRGDSAYFARWQDERGDGRVSTHWGVDQADSAAVLGLLDARGLTELDLVLDDASHLYEPTLRSFETLFDRLRPGGWYVIEDWSWSLRPEFRRRDHPWGDHRSLHPLAHRLLDLQGSRPDVVPSVRVFPDFLAVERGAAPLAGRVADRIVRRQRPWRTIAVNRARTTLGRWRRRIT